MEHSLYSSGIGKGTYTPRTRQSSASSAVSSRKSMFGNLKKASGSGRYSISGRSTQSTEIFTRSENNIVESFGLPLPVLIKEALTFSERNASVSINCSNNGWAWAVCGRRLLVWQYRESKAESPKIEGIRTPQRRIATGQCRELTLPHCDIGHKASLVTVFLSEGQQMASCLSVSPTGDVRYWPSISHDGSSIDETGILEGQEFDKLIRIFPLGYILVTTTCSLVLLQFQLNGGRYTIVHRSVKPPTGFLGGIGKKFASIIIGMNSSDKENKFLKVCAENINNLNWVISILSDRWIQRWIFSQNSSEQFLFEDVDVVRKIRETFQQKIWPNRDMNEIEMWMLDMQPYDRKLIILAAAVNASHTQQLYYALIILAEESNSLNVKNFHQIKHTSFYSTESPMECLKMKFVINRNIVYMYGEKIIYQILLNDVNNEEIEKIEFPIPTDKIMAASIFNQIPLFFTRHYGLVCVTAADVESGDFFESTLQNDMFGTGADHSFLTQSIHNDMSTNLSMYDLDPDEIYSSDEISQIKAAFIYYLKTKLQRCTAILNDLFENGKTGQASTEGVATTTVNGTLIDNIIIIIAKDLAEDIPTADPRWEQIKTNNHPLGSSSSMQIMQQLKEKNVALIHFIDFLHATELWGKFGVISDHGNIKPTYYVLSDINEKIIATLSLKRIHNSYSKLIDDAIHKVLVHRSEQTIPNLTPQDLFYVKTTRIHEIFKMLSNIAEELVQIESSPSRISTTIVDINTIVLTILYDVIKFRESKAELFAPPSDKQSEYEYLPWTASSGKNGLRDILLTLINVTLNFGARSTGEPELRQQHYKQMMELIDLVLNGRREYLESMKGNDKYNVLVQRFESQRSELIFPFVNDNQYELATKLAEKYYDFHTLVLICDATGNQQRLDEYIKLYKNMDFSQYAINWYLRQNKRGDLFERFKHNQDELAKFLGDHPTLAWIQCVFNGDLSHASRILFMLAQSETDLIARKKTMLSMAKLTLLAGDQDLTSLLTDINTQLLLVDYQKQLPPNLLANLGFDIKNMKVLKPEEIIELFISDANESANEFEHRKALEILSYVDDPAIYRHKIWCSTILRDNWLSYNINAPHEDLQNTIFFKLVELNFFMDGELDDFLPPIEDFLEAKTELGNLTSEKSFQYLMKLAYEHIYETYKGNCE